jgi:hypothetical protein
VAACRTCGGDGRVPLTRCPSFYVGPRERFAVEAAVMFLDTQCLPFEGAWTDMPATLMDAILIVGEERADIQRREQERVSGKV